MLSGRRAELLPDPNTALSAPAYPGPQTYASLLYNDEGLKRSESLFSASSVTLFGYLFKSKLPKMRPICR